jgi:hypothetical protein
MVLAKGLRELAQDGFAEVVDDKFLCHVEKVDVAGCIAGARRGAAGGEGCCGGGRGRGDLDARGGRVWSAHPDFGDGVRGHHRCAFLTGDRVVLMPRSNKS